MKKIKIVYALYTIHLIVAVLLFFDKAAASVVPDALIRAELDAVFVNQPTLKGFPFQDQFSDAAEKYGLPLPYLLAVGRGESFFNPQAKSAKGALGIMQVMPGTAADYGIGADELLDPSKNIETGVHFLADLYTKLDDPYLTLGAYYCGLGGLSEDKTMLRKDCDEYVRYIHSHLKTIITKQKGIDEKPDTADRKFVFTWFDNFIDAESFVGMLSRSLPQLETFILRREVEDAEYSRYRYQIFVKYNQKKGKQATCQDIENAIGFNFCG